MGILSPWCNRLDCTRPAEWRIVLRLYPVGYPKRHPHARAAEAVLDLGVCTPHKEALVVGDIVDDAGWQQILDRFEEHHMVPPDRDAVELDFEPIVRELQ